MRTVISGGTLITETGSFRGDLAIEGDKIVAIGAEVVPEAGDQPIDATGCYVMPGLVDPHVHFLLRSGPFTTADDFETGSRAAACGGITTVIDYVNQPQGGSLLEAIDKRRTDADGKIHIDYGLHSVVVDLAHGQIDELPEVVGRGIPSAKVFTTYRDAGLYADDLMILTLMEQARDIGLLVAVHAENDAIVEGTRLALERSGHLSLANHGRSRPAVAEIEAVSRIILLAGVTDCPLYIVHMTTPEAILLAVAAREKGQPVITESCPQYLTLDDSVFDREHPEEFICSPPIRPAQTAASLRQLLGENAIQTLGSDHCGYTREQKHGATSILDSPQGIPGVETEFPVLYSRLVATGELPLERLLKLLSTNPARVYGLYPDKGSLQVGTDADVMVYDPDPEWVLGDADLHGAPGSYTPYAGSAMKGRVALTMLRGKVIYRDGEFLGKSGDGKFVPGRPFDRSVVKEL